MINYRIYGEVGKFQNSKHPLYSYIFAKNGNFLKAERDLVQAIMPLCPGRKGQEIRGLSNLEPLIRLHPAIRPVGARMVSELFRLAREAKDPHDQPLEIMWYLVPKQTGLWEWQLVTPAQVQERTTCYPLDKTSPAYQQGLIEIHSHHALSARFSPTDDADEVGFRFYAVIGNVFDKPQIRLRLGIYGYFWEIPASFLFDLPPGVRDLNSAEGFNLAYPNPQFYRGNQKFNPTQ